MVQTARTYDEAMARKVAGQIARSMSNEQKATTLKRGIDVSAMSSSTIGSILAGALECAVSLTPSPKRKKPRRRNQAFKLSSMVSKRTCRKEALPNSCPTSFAIDRFILSRPPKGLLLVVSGIHVNNIVLCDECHLQNTS